MANKDLTFAPFGNFGVAAAVADGYAFIRIPLDKASGRSSKSGKMVLTGDTGSFQTIPGTDGLRANISAGYSAK